MIKFLPLKRVCKQIVDCPHESPEWLREGITVIRNFNLVDGQLDLSDRYCVDEETYEKRIKRAVPSYGDIIFSREAPIGNCAIIPPNTKCCLGQRLVLLRVDTDVCSSKYLLAALQSQYVKQQIEQVSKSGSIVSNFNISALKELIIPVVSEQETVSNISATLNRKVRTNKEIIDSLEAVAKTLYDYWFVQFDFPDENGKPYKSSGGKMIWDEELGQKIPDGWKSVPLSSVFEFEKGRIPNHIETAPTTECDTPYLTIDVVNAGAPSFCSSKNMILANGEVLMVMDGAASSDVYAGYNGAIGSTFAKCTIKNKSMSNQLLYVILRRYNKNFAKVNTGSTVPHANKDYILNFRIPLPNCAKLKDLSEKFVSILSLVYAAREENRELTSFRDFLLPMLMNGQVKIKDSESGAERNAET